jgi:intraflagellar transport protein 122
MELGSLTIRSKPFGDKDGILPICARCSMANPLISDKNSCFNCKHPFIVSFMSFEVLPLIEFKPAQNISHNKVLELVNSVKVSKAQTNKKGGKDNWNQSIGQNQQVLSYEANQSMFIFNI